MGKSRSHNDFSTELDSLFQKVSSYRDSKNYRELLGFIKRLPQVAPYNAFLVHMQKPGAVYVAHASIWEREFNRHVKPDAHPLVILIPFGPVTFVFDLNDTEGEPFPEALLNPFAARGSLDDRSFNRLISNLPRIGVAYYEADQGTQSAGFIKAARPGKTTKLVDIKNTQKGQIEQYYKVKIVADLVVNKHHKKIDKFATILHELGHLHCGHLGIPVNGFCTNTRRGDEQTQEFEAESVSWIVCSRRNIETPSDAYLNHYMDTMRLIPPVQLGKIIKTAGLIENMLNKKIEIRKENIIESGKRKI